MRSRMAAALGVLLGVSACSEEQALQQFTPGLSVEPIALAFGETSIYAPKTRPLLLNSSGSADLEIRAIRVDGASEFFVDDAALTLGPGVTEVLEVRYAPSSATVAEGRLVLLTNVEETPEITVPLTGFGFDTCIDPDGDLYGTGCPAGNDCNQNDPLVNPAVIESCDGRDDDCGGEVDEEYYVGTSCEAVSANPDGSECRRPGLVRCAGAYETRCEVEQSELCNRLDDDCDGEIDEGLAVGTACTVETQFCSRPGVIACAPDGRATTCQLLDDPQERCNGVDDDCDGATDEGFGLGALCLAVDGACFREGAMACNAGGDGAQCAGDPRRPETCCDDPLRPNAGGSCCEPLPAAPCAGTCAIDLQTGRHTCGAALPFTVVSVQQGVARLSLELVGRLGVELRIEACDPTGTALHLSDSSTGVATGDDGGTSEHDAELVVDGRDLVRFASDAIGAGPAERREPNFFPNGCETRRIWVGDGRVQAFDPCLVDVADELLRISPPADAQGTPDSIWHLAIGQAWADPTKTGTGVRRVELCLR